MCRKRIYFDWNVPKNVVRMVNAICRDYERREKALKRENLDSKAQARYQEFNHIVDGALAEIEPGIRKQFLADICAGRGYDFSQCSPYIGKEAYYLKKRKLIHDIAEGLFLI